ncbi:MAG: hypothetical protein NC313_16530 [Butyrivibrio sp.]|nr:hypothetical protein [Butyrivibrio sp.]
MKLLEQIKKSMRISHNALDEMLRTDIEAGALDLLRAGVQPYQPRTSKTIKKDALIHKAIELYAKWQEDYNGKGETYEKSYKGLRDSLALCGDYNE